VDQPVDPTPGDSWGVGQLANAYGQVAVAADDVSGIISRVEHAASGGAWVGLAGDTFRSQLCSLPEDSRKCADSYDIACQASTIWASRLEQAQSKADTNLAKAKEAGADLAAAQAALSSALAVEDSAWSKYQGLERLAALYQGVEPPAHVTLPSSWQRARARNACVAASSTVGSCRQQVTDAEAALQAAKRLVAEAKEEYVEASRVVVAKLGEAEYGKITLKNKDVDHILDLQLGGTSVLENLQLLDRSVNRSLGSQIMHRLKSVPPNKKVKIVFME
jgi:hypothetical protein